MIEKLKLKVGRIKTASDELISLSNNMNKEDDLSKKVLESVKRIEETVKDFRL